MIVTLPAKDWETIVAFLGKAIWELKDDSNAFTIYMYIKSQVSKQLAEKNSRPKRKR